MSRGILVLLACAIAPAAAAQPSTPAPPQHAMGSVPCSWSVPIERADHSLDVDATIRLLRANHFDCYVQPIEQKAPMLYDDFMRLLPAAQAAGISIWPVLLPAHEGASPPHGLDFVKWMQELAKLSLKYPVIRGVNIDDTDVGGNENVFTREYVCRIHHAKQEINPTLLFIPTIYDLDRAEADMLAGCVDGVWLWWVNLEQNNGLRATLENGRAVAAGRFPVYGGVYAHSTSWHRDAGPKPAILEHALELACTYSDGAVVWQLPLTADSNPWLDVVKKFMPGGSSSLAGKCGTEAAPPTRSPAAETSGRSDQTMQNLMDAYARHHHGKVSLYAKALRTGQTVAIDPDVSVNTASVIKLAIMLEAMYQVKEHRVSLEDVLHLRKEDQVSGSGVLLLFHTPAEINFETAIVLMITQSDNTAANLVLAHVGRENVNTRMRSLGFQVTTSIRPIGHSEQGDQSPELKPFGIGRTSAREMAGILEAIDRCDLGDRTLCARMIDILEHQFWRNCIPHYLEDADTTEVASHVANKTGSLNKVRNDVALVYTKDGPIVISAFTYDNADTSWTPENEADLVIARMAKTIVDGWAPHGLGKER